MNTIAAKGRRLLKFALALAVMSSVSSAPAFAKTDVHVLDVGQGLSVLVKSQDHYMLYDGGDRDRSDYVVSYLKQQGIAELDYMIASHYDADHINGLVGALNTTSVKQVFAPEYTTDTKVFQSFRDTIATKSVPKKQPAVGSTYPLGDATFQILSPAGTGYRDANDYSIAIRITDGDTSFLITGDAEAAAEAEMCGSGLPLESDVYVMGHHGSASSSSWDLLQKAVPEYAVLSCGTDNPYGHPHIESMEKLQAMEIPLFRTDRQGAIIASTDGAAITWNVSPCNDYSPGSADDRPAQPQAQDASQSAGTDNTAITETAEYILNTSTKKIHYPGCRSAAQIKAENKRATSESRDSMTAQGYTPCANGLP